MEGFNTKQEEKLFRALQTLIHHSVDTFGNAKKATPAQIRKANQALTDYEKFIRKNYKRNES